MLACLIIASFFNRTCLYVVIALFSTLLLPCKPLLWPAFNRMWIFKTWRHYFKYRCAAASWRCHARQGGWLLQSAGI